MPEVIKVLVDSDAARSPAAAAYVVLYTVPALTSAIWSCLVCNRGAAATSFQMSIVRPGGGVITPGAETFICYDVPIDLNELLELKITQSMEAGCKVVVRSAAALVIYTGSGVEIS